MGLIQIELPLSYSRLEKAITKLEPARAEIDPMTNFWNIYKKFVDEHDDDLVSKCVGDLDSSLLFVSAFTFLACLIHLNRIPFPRRRVYSLPSLPHSSFKPCRSSSQTPPI